MPRPARPDRARSRKEHLQTANCLNELPSKLPYQSCLTKVAFEVALGRGKPTRRSERMEMCSGSRRKQVNSLKRARDDHDQGKDKRPGTELGWRSGSAAALVYP